MGRTAVETVVGGLVLVVAGMFAYFTYSTAEIKTVEGYQLSAIFFEVGGLKKGADVQLNGVKVGTVTDLTLDGEGYVARVNLSIANSVKLPRDTAAGIASEGILGGKYLRLFPGTMTEFLQPGDQVTNTQNYRSLEDQVGDIIFLATGSKGGQ